MTDLIWTFRTLSAVVCVLFCVTLSCADDDATTEGAATQETTDDDSSEGAQDSESSETESTEEESADAESAEAEQESVPVDPEIARLEAIVESGGSDSTNLVDRLADAVLDTSYDGGLDQLEALLNTAGESASGDDAARVELLKRLVEVRKIAGNETIGDDALKVVQLVAEAFLRAEGDAQLASDYVKVRPFLVDLKDRLGGEDDAQLAATSLSSTIALLDAEFSAYVQIDDQHPAEPKQIYIRNDDDESEVQIRVRPMGVTRRSDWVAVDLEPHDEFAFRFVSALEVVTHRQRRNSVDSPTELDAARYVLSVRRGGRNSYWHWEVEDPAMDEQAGDETESGEAGESGSDSESGEAAEGGDSEDSSSDEESGDSEGSTEEGNAEEGNAEEGAGEADESGTASLFLLEDLQWTVFQEDASSEAAERADDSADDAGDAADDAGDAADDAGDAADDAGDAADDAGDAADDAGDAADDDTPSFMPRPAPTGLQAMDAEAWMNRATRFEEARMQDDVANLQVAVAEGTLLCVLSNEAATNTEADGRHSGVETYDYFESFVHDLRTSLETRLSEAADELEPEDKESIEQTITEVGLLVIERTKCDRIRDLAQREIDGQNVSSVDVTEDLATWVADLQFQIDTLTEQTALLYLKTVQLDLGTRQEYSAWRECIGRNYYWCTYCYRPEGSDQTEKSLCFYFLDDPDFVYYYHPTTCVYWGRYSISAGIDGWAWLPVDERRRQHFGQRPTGAFDKTGPMPVVQGSEDPNQTILWPSLVGLPIEFGKSEAVQYYDTAPPAPPAPEYDVAPPAPPAA